MSPSYCVKHNQHAQHAKLLMLEGLKAPPGISKKRGSEIDFGGISGKNKIKNYSSGKVVPWQYWSYQLCQPVMFINIHIPSTRVWANFMEYSYPQKSLKMKMMSTKKSVM